jgi:hypothetical protein
MQALEIWLEFMKRRYQYAQLLNSELHDHWKKKKKKKDYRWNLFIPFDGLLARLSNKNKRGFYPNPTPGIRTLADFWRGSRGQRNNIRRVLPPTPAPEYVVLVCPEPDI